MKQVTTTIGHMKAIMNAFDAPYLTVFAAFLPFVPLASDAHNAAVAAVNIANEAESNNHDNWQDDWGYVCANGPEYYVNNPSGEDGYTTVTLRWVSRSSSEYKFQWREDQTANHHQAIFCYPEDSTLSKIFEQITAGPMPMKAWDVLNEERKKAVPQRTRGTGERALRESKKRK